MTKRVVFCLAAVFYLSNRFSDGALAVPAASEDPSGSLSSRSDSSSNRKAKTKFELNSYKGIYLGYVEATDEKRTYAFLAPSTPTHPRKKFYMDKLTRCSEDGRRVRCSKLKPWDKVAVRYFSMGNIAVAEEIFFVTGPFVPFKYKRVTRRTRRGRKRR